MWHLRNSACFGSELSKELTAESFRRNANVAVPPEDIKELIVVHALDGALRSNTHYYLCNDTSLARMFKWFDDMHGRKRKMIHKQRPMAIYSSH